MRPLGRLAHRWMGRFGASADMSMPSERPARECRVIPCSRHGLQDSACAGSASWGPRNDLRTLRDGSTCRTHSATRSFGVRSQELWRSLKGAKP
jgi:hypothetical protein